MFKITCITMGNKMPTWVEEGCQEYLKRLQDVFHIQCIEIPLMKRQNPHDRARILDKEMALMQQAIPPQARRIALDATGQRFSSEMLAQKIEQFQQASEHLCFLMGSPEGFTPDLLASCHEKWSLSPLTFPHTIARIVLLEALYRSWSILQNHPYHK